MKTVFWIAGALALGLALGIALSAGTVRYLHKRVRELRAGVVPAGILRSVTKLIFVTTQVSALIWVFMSYGIAIYSTVRLEQVYTMAELSEPAIHTILGVGVLKVLENIFEHNEGAVFGRNRANSGTGDEAEDQSMG